ncbi:MULTISPECIES: GlxA family transcriptional regulator [Cupriavidus]|uniref:GlxA family transcriptional regulator n=1 Tax=Cupriavidus oxalaticus TaxID=96344 RepID=A0A4P7L4T1_9BURK|nr:MULTISPECIES: GlxA family transcriptional regulator [Cupriavidus]MBF6986171.1 GlxA family transcriptional regulator [Cupriavidus sp. IK-TO18]QBY50320.1 GlxA family transcriptional regulator [Cupriavidus oxalaticus]TDF63978.1 GlxA family transcriptional regulator [Cupriavidus sp. L7L]
MKRVGLVVFPGFQILDIVPVSVFELANAAAPRAAYDIHVVSESGGAVKSSMGTAVQTVALDPNIYDTIIMAGATTPQPSSPRLRKLLARALEPTRRMAGICTGAFVLAEAGILEGRRVTTHWAHARELQRRYPSIRVEEDRIFIRDGTIWTSAGMTACIDLALALVEGDLGSDVSRAVARQLVVHHRRSGGQSQFSTLSELESRSDRIQAALTYAKNHLREDLSVERLAHAVHMSPRHFSREFRLNTGQPPARAVERLRAETARILVEADRLTIERIASETGFSDPERMRRAFLRVFGQPPQALKRAARSRLAADSAQL